MGLLGSVINVFKSVGYILTGNFDDLAVAWSSNPAAIRATGAAGIAKKQKRLAAIAKALSPSNIQIKKLEGTIAKKQDRLDKLPDLISRARVAAQQVATNKSLSKEQAGKDPEVVEYLTALGNFVKEQEALTKDIDKARREIAAINTRRATMIAQGQTLQKEIEEAGAKIDATVSAVIMSKEEKAANALFIGAQSADNGNKEMDALDRIREQAEGEAEAARDLSGMNVTSVEAKLLSNGALGDNSAMLDLLSFPEDKVSAPAAVEKLPEH